MYQQELCMTAAEADPLISVVVTCRNQREQALALLRALLAQQETYPRSELILVDHGSADNTRQAVLGGFPGVRIVSAPAGLTRARASSLGTVVANGTVVAVVDCAAPVEPGLFRRLADAYLSATRPAPEQLIIAMPPAPSLPVEALVQPAA